MLEVYHHTLCPFSRKLRIVLNEKQIEFKLILEPYWERRIEFLALNPACTTPLVLKQDQVALISNSAIFEYFEEVVNERNLIGESPIERAKVRSICDWFDNKFYHEVTKHIISEKFIKSITKGDEPNSQIIRATRKNLYEHIRFISYLLQKSDYLCGEKITLADISAVAQLSVLDFFGDVPWEADQEVKHWYSLLKSRPSFKSLLLDKIQGIIPPAHYNNPDF